MTCWQANIDWEATAAMGQAVGSVLAIAAAIWIDQGAARRLRKDREAAERNEIAAREEALNWARAATCAAIREVEAFSLTNSTRGGLSDTCKRNLLGARDAIRYYLDMPSPAEPNLVARLVLSHRVLIELEDNLNSCGRFSDEQGRKIYLDVLGRALRDAAEADLMGLV